MFNCTRNYQNKNLVSPLWTFSISAKSSIKNCKHINNILYNEYKYYNIFILAMS